MRSKTVKKIISETSEETKQKAIDCGNFLTNKEKFENAKYFFINKIDKALLNRNRSRK